MQLRALADELNWDALEAFGLNKKSPIGYSPFVEVLLQKHAPRDRINKFIPKLNSTEEKVNAYCSTKYVSL